MENRSFTRTTRQLLDLTEGALGTDPRWPFYRRSILRLINNLKRETAEIVSAAPSTLTVGEKNWINQQQYGGLK